MAQINWGIIGGGIMGMTLADRLIKQGHKVTIFESAKKEMTIIELAEMLNDIADKSKKAKIKLIPFDKIFSDRKYQDVMRHVPDTSKSERIVEFKAKTAMREGFRFTFEWQNRVTNIKTKTV